MQAGRYGVPQSRERVIVLASRGDVPLPDFPLPTHTFNRRATWKNLANGEQLHPIQRAGDTHPFPHDCSCAPLPPATVDDYLDDLVSVSSEFVGIITDLSLSSLPSTGLYSNKTSFCSLIPTQG